MVKSTKKYNSWNKSHSWNPAWSPWRSRIQNCNVHFIYACACHWCWCLLYFLADMDGISPRYAQIKIFRNTRCRNCHNDVNRRVFKFIDRWKNSEFHLKSIWGQLVAKTSSWDARLSWTLANLQLCSLFTPLALCWLRPFLTQSRQELYVLGPSNWIMNLYLENNQRLFLLWYDWCCNMGTGLLLYTIT